jgi:hypothetical protein
MSVVICCGLFKGVLLASDCRVTWIDPKDGSTQHSDDAQKIFHVAPGTAIGFVGDLGAAAHLLEVLVKHLGKRNHLDPVSLRRWFPRLFRREYKIYSHGHAKPPRVDFIVPFVLRFRRNVVRRAELGSLFVDVAKRGHGMPAYLFHLIKESEGKEWVSLNDCPYSAFYTMRSPNFVPEVARPLTYRAIGSGGRKMFDQIGRYNDLIVSQPNQPAIEILQLQMALYSMANTLGEPTVGGLYQMLRVNADSTDYIPMQTQISIGTPNQTDISLSFENGRWIQRNLTSGNEVPLLLPWELLSGRPSGKRFDDFATAWGSFQGAAYLGPPLKT